MHVDSWTHGVLTVHNIRTLGISQQYENDNNSLLNFPVPGQCLPAQCKGDTIDITFSLSKG